MTSNVLRAATLSILLLISIPVAGTAETCPDDLLFARHGRICYQPPLWLAADAAKIVEQAVEGSLAHWLDCDEPLEVRVVEVAYSEATLQSSNRGNERFAATADAVESALAKACQQATVSSEVVVFDNTSKPTEAEMAQLLETLHSSKQPQVLVASKEILIALGEALATSNENKCPGVAALAEAWQTNAEDSNYFYTHLWALGDDGYSELAVDYSDYDDCHAIGSDGEVIDCPKPRSCAARADSGKSDG